MTNKVSFKNIETREQLLSRIENNMLSVGCFIDDIRHFLSDKQTETNTQKVIVRYSAQYGTHDKEFYI